MLKTQNFWRSGPTRVWARIMILSEAEPITMRDYFSKVSCSGTMNPPPQIPRGIKSNPISGQWSVRGGSASRQSVTVAFYQELTSVRDPIQHFCISLTLMGLSANGWMGSLGFTQVMGSREVIRRPLDGALMFSAKLGHRSRARPKSLRLFLDLQHTNTDTESDREPQSWTHTENAVWVCIVPSPFSTVRPAFHQA